MLTGSTSNNVLHHLKLLVAIKLTESSVLHQIQPQLHLWMFWLLLVVCLLLYLIRF